jgi:hypothetical protein
MAVLDKAAALAESVRRLEQLAAELDQAGWRTRLDAGDDRVPCLHVQNPQPGAGALAEDIYCAPRRDAWTYWWSWAEPICVDVVGAVAIIGRVLRSADPAHYLGGVE